MPTPATGAQVATPFVGTGHAWLQAPQFDVSVVRLSHALPLHAVKFALHVNPHAPLVQVAAPFAGAVQA